MVLLLFAALAVGGFWYAYERLVGYERAVARHVPPSARLVVRADLEQVVLFEPVRRHVFPVLERQLARSDGLSELEQQTGIELAMDLREVMFVQPASDAWLLAVGGLFPTTGVVAGLGELASRRGIAGCTVAGERLSCPRQSFFAQQASDGVLLLSSSPDVLSAALEPSDAYQALGLGLADAAGFAVDGRWLADLAQWTDLPVIGGVASDFSAMKQFAGASGHVELGTETRVIVRLRPTQGASLAPLLPAVEGMLQTVSRLLSVVEHSDVVGERTLLASASARATENGAIEIVSPWPREDIDRAARSVADWLGRWGNALGNHQNGQ